MDVSKFGDLRTIVSTNNNDNNERRRRRSWMFDDKTEVKSENQFYINVSLD